MCTGPNVQAEFAREIRRFVACGTGLVDFTLVGRQVSPQSKK